MKIDILTLFPELFIALKTYGLIGKAIEDGVIDLNIVNIRDFSKDKHKSVDDEIYGGGPGMLMTVEPIYEAIMSVKRKDSKVIYLSPQGKLLNQKIVIEKACEDHLILLCGHYEGIDQRALDLLVDEELSIGDYVLTGGEIPALVLVDAVMRFVPGVIGNKESLTEDSLYSGYLKYPCYTRPASFMGLDVPDVLLSGNHKKIDEYRKQESIRVTREKRPDLLEKINLNDD